MKTCRAIYDSISVSTSLILAGTIGRVYRRSQVKIARHDLKTPFPLFPRNKLSSPIVFFANSVILATFEGQAPNFIGYRQHRSQVQILSPRFCNRPEAPEVRLRPSALTMDFGAAFSLQLASPSGKPSARRVAHR